MTVVVEETPTTAAIQESPQNALAPWHVRAGAFAVDVLPGIAVVATMVLVAFTVPPRGVWWWVCISVAGVAFLLMLVNRLLLPTVTGWSLGRASLESRWYGRDGEATGAVGAVAQGPRPPARYRVVAGGMAVATMGFKTSHFRRHAAAHRSATRRTRRAAAQRTAMDRSGSADRGGRVRGRCRDELYGGVLARSGDRSNARNRLRFRGRRSSHRC